MTALSANQQIEASILGSILLDNALLFEAEAVIGEKDFSLSSHRAIFSRISAMVNEGRQADSLTLFAELERTNQLNTVGGAGYIADLTSGLPRFGRLDKSWLRIVKEASSRREIQNALRSALTDSEDPANTAESVAADLESRLLALRANSESVDLSIGDVADARAERFSLIRSGHAEPIGLPSGVEVFDSVTKGFRPGQIVQFGARTSQGKTCFLTQAAVTNCQAGTPVLIFSLEMTKEQLLDRIYAQISGVPFFRVDDPTIASDDDEFRIRAATQEVKRWPLFIAADSKLDINKIVATARLAIRRHGVKLVFVDYCQIVKCNIRDVRERLTQVSRSLTDLAREENVPVLALSQLTRPGKSGVQDPAPTVNELRESSQLENDAHVVALLHRPRNPEEDGRASSTGELIIAKNRNGETGAYPVFFDRRSLTFAAPARNARPR